MTRLDALAFAALATTSPAFGSAFHNDNTGLYNAVNESGWAVAFEQQGDAITATIYTYDSNGAPTWYSATLSLGVNAYPWSDLWSGDLYATTGPWFGAPFDTSETGYRKVGTLSFIKDGRLNFIQGQVADGGTVTFTIDGVAVTKQIYRWTFRLDDYTGTYRGLYKTVSDCGSPPVASTTYTDATIKVIQAGNSLSIVTSRSDGNSCTYSGDYTQSGQLGYSVGRFVCTNGLSGGGTPPSRVPFYYDMNVTPSDFRASFSGGDSNGCSIGGNVVGIRQTPDAQPQ
jgi:hypothetical protein